ncbi:MAG: NAD-dependent epimerase/dehydratase family protein [Candidatus Udaeobacter sp.]
MEKTARVLVTGGSGMVGRALIGHLRQDGYENIFAPSSRQLDLRDQTATHEFFALARLWVRRPRCCREFRIMPGELSR